tara:strand:+ start:41 stop:430 length:390 start_codon:yes stop_codon:yes gene_type:complete
MKNKILKSSNRSFGIVFFVVFLVIGIYPLINSEDLRVWAIVLSIIFLILGLLNSQLLNPLNILWFKFGILLGNIVSPIIMALIFFLIIYPTGILVRLFKKNFLGLRFEKELASYWILKKGNKSYMKDQF